MPILSETDLAVFAPDLCLSGAPLIAAITRAQIMAEGKQGADRPLEKVTFSEILTLPSGGQLFFSRLPVASVSLIEVRVGNEWRSLQPTDYESDLNQGRIWVKNPAGWQQYAYLNWSVPTPTEPRRKTEARVTYETGFDFSQDTPEIRMLKGAIAGIMQVQSSKAYQGVRSFAIENVRVEYDSSLANSGGGMRIQLEDYLSVFRKYKPRSFF